MPNAVTSPVQTAVNRLRTVFRVWMVVLSLVGVVALLASQLIEKASASEVFGGVLRDVGTALIVAVSVGAVIEYYVKKRAQEDIALDVVAAVFKRFMPDTIFDQIKGVLQAPVYRSNWRVAIRLAPGFDELRELGIYVLRYTMRYESVNGFSAEREYACRGGIDVDVGTTCHPEGQSVPRFCKIEIKVPGDGDPVSEEFDAEQGKAVLAGASEGDRLKITRFPDNRVIFESKVRLPPNGRAEVHYELLRAIRVPGVFVISAAEPATDIRIQFLDVEPVHFDVIPLHPTPPKDPWLGGEYVFKAGILPWQGFQIRASSKETESAGDEPGGSVAEGESPPPPPPAPRRGK